MATRTNSLDLLPPGVDPYQAEAAVLDGWMRCFSAEVTAYKTGLPVAYVTLVCDRLRAKFRGLGVDWKRERAERLLAVNQHVRQMLLDRITTAPDGKFAISDVRELREYMLLEMKQLGLLAPEKLQAVEGYKTLDELIEQCKIYGIPIPTDEYGPDPEPITALPARESAA